MAAGLPVSSFALDNEVFKGPSYDGMRATMDSKSGLMGYIDDEGNRIAPLKYTRALEFINGVGIATMLVGEKEEYYAIDTDGKVKKFDPALGTIDYYDGTFGVASIPSNNPILPIKSALLDKDGNRITGYDYDGIYVRYIKNTHKTIILAHKGENIGVIDPSGKEIIPIEYNSIQWFPAYPDIFSVSKQVSPGQFKAGYIRSNGRILFDAKYDSAAEFEEGFGRLQKNGKWVYSDQEPIIEKNRTLAPFRAIAEALCYSVEWDGENQSVILQNADKIIQLEIDSNQATVNTFDDGKAPETVMLDAPASLINGRTFVPVRFLAENIGAEVSWEPNTKTINIKTNK